MFNDPPAIQIQNDIARARAATRKIYDLIAWLRSLYPQQNEAEVLRLQIYQLQEQLAMLEAA
ncbi:MAG: hypothetical protein ABID84_03600 [Chloroflexota bacterium]